MHFIDRFNCCYFPQLQLTSELNVTAPSMGRFGTTISSVADLNGDGLRDVAVGAPLEDDNKGAVYIYLGDRRKGMRSTFSQVRQRKPDTLKHFSEKKIAIRKRYANHDALFQLSNFCYSRESWERK